MKVYILSIIDLESVGFQTKDVEVYLRKEDATASMRKQYLEKFEQMKERGWKIDNPDAQDNSEHQFTNGYAYLYGEYYWDIFEKEVPNE